MIEVDIKTLLKIKNLKISLQVNKLPIYPDFKNITQDDLDIIKNFVTEYPPYSEFSPLTILTWDLYTKGKYSFLNNNLVLRVRDEFNKKYIYTFLGTNKIDDTINNLLRSKTQLRLVPGVNFIKANSLNKRINIKIDINNLDYIYSTNELTKLKGNKYKDKRYQINKFHYKFPKVYFTEYELNKDNLKQILGVNKLWEKNKKLTSEENKAEIELLTRLCSNRLNINYKIFGAFDNQNLIGYMLIENFNSKWVLVHQMKTNIRYQFINDALMHELAKYLFSKNFVFINLMQDLGFNGLRQYKRSWRPIKLLKKYSITKS